MTDDPTGTPEPVRVTHRPLFRLAGLPDAPADAIDSDHDAAADLPWGADDPHPPVPTGDPDEVPVATDPTPYTLGPWERDGAWAWVRCWQRPGVPHRPVAASVSTLPREEDWLARAHVPGGVVRRYVRRGRGALAEARHLADGLLRAAWPDMTRGDL